MLGTVPRTCVQRPRDCLDLTANLPTALLITHSRDHPKPNALTHRSTAWTDKEIIINSRSDFRSSNLMYPFFGRRFGCDRIIERNKTDDLSYIDPPKAGRWLSSWMLQVITRSVISNVVVGIMVIVVII